MRAFVLDPKISEIKEINITDAGDIKSLLIRPFFAYWIDNKNALFIDANSDGHVEGIMIVPGADRPFFGKGIIIGFDPFENNYFDCFLSVSCIRKKVVFLPLEAACN